jgi:GH15 family glucan-1,4-alpha-glucosidase
VGASRAYPPIGDYAVLSDCRSGALVSTVGSIDWCCMPRFDQGSLFGRLLHWEGGGHCSIRPRDSGAASFRRYLEGTLVLETTFRTGGGEARLLDFFAMAPDGQERRGSELVRIVEGTRGRMQLCAEICPRFDYGEVKPWIRHEGLRTHSAIGGNDGLLIAADVDLRPAGPHELGARFSVRAGDRVHLLLRFERPERLDEGRAPTPTPAELDERLEETVRWWRDWSAKIALSGPDGPAAVRSAVVLKALSYAPTGAVAAALTTSLPERIGGERNWDYRLSWVRDSTLSVRSLVALGCEAEADAFRRFVERSAAGSVDDLQIAYGVGGERRLNEYELAHLEGYRGSRPVRVGNAAVKQRQLDVYGELLHLALRWHERGHSPDDDYWRFIVELVDVAARHWREPDRGIWERRGEPLHLVHSKAMCWAALEFGIRLAEECMRRAPVRRWARERDALRRTIERRGYDRKRGVFVRSFGERRLDASLLLLPTVGFVAWDDERMVRTVDAIRDELEDDGLLYRNRGEDGLAGEEGAFLPCSFWLVECLANQGRHDEARRVFDRAVSTANELGLFAEEYDPKSRELLGNYPQALTHLSHIAAAVALSRLRPVPHGEQGPAAAIAVGGGSSSGDDLRD